MESLSSHYRQLLGLDENWKVSSVNLSMEEKRVEIALKHVGDSYVCSECSSKCGLHDHAAERKWRHLDTMQFETILSARIPRTNCQKCGVKTISIPWAQKHSRFTLMFEAFAIDVLLAASSVSKAAELLGLGWDAVHAIMQPTF